MKYKLFRLKNLFCGFFGVQNLFCGFFGVQNLFCGFLNACYFAVFLECKIYFAAF